MNIDLNEEDMAILLDASIRLIDGPLGKGFAAANPALLAGVMHAWVSMELHDTIQEELFQIRQRIE